MTSTAFATSLSLPVMDDTMEMSSPARNNDGDIDIDFEDYGGGLQNDDEHMFEDGELARPGTATDDMMADDEHFNVTSAPVVEAEMQDDVPYQPQDGDEELIDYSDAELAGQLPDEPIPDAVPEVDLSQHNDASFLANAQAIPEVAPTAVEHEVTLPESEAPAVEAHNASVPSEEQTTSQDVTAEPPLSTTVEAVPATKTPVEESNAQDEAGEVEPNATQIDVPLEWDERTLDAALEEEFDREEEPALKAPPELPGTIDTSAASFVADGPPTPTDTGLHPMVIQFGDNEWPLFKSRAQPDGLLKDDNLVNLSLAELLRSCRQRLNKRFGDAVSNDQDLVLGFDRIGLMLMDSSTHASAISLNDILEVYLNLHQNDGVGDIPQLSMTLSTQLKFTSHLTLLRQAAATGTGISTYVSATDHDDADEYDEDEQYPAEEDASEKEDQEQIQHQQVESAEHGNIQEPTDNTDQYHEEGHEYHEYQEGDQDGQEYNIDQYDEGNYEYDETADPEQNDEQQAAQDHSAAEAQADEAAPEDTVHEGQEIVQPDSTASAATVHAETLNDGAGKYYPEDEIIWDEDDLTMDFPESHEDGGDDEVSALLATYDESEALPNVSAANEQPDVENVANPANEPEHVAETANEDEYALGEDFLNEDFTEYAQVGDQDGDNDFGAGEPDFDNLVETGDQHDQYDFNQADNVEHGQEGEAQTAEDDDQFHTAFDLLDGTELEDGEEAGQQEANGAVPEEDVIGFDDDDEEPVLPAEKSPTGSLHGKRSFDETADDDELNFDEPDLKKPRSD